jgi:ribosome biogenesis ATPase
VVTTSNPEDLDSLIKRPGLIDKNCAINLPTALERSEILELMMEGIQTELDEFYWIGEKTTGFVCSDLKELVSQACFEAVKRVKSIKFDNEKLLKKANKLKKNMDEDNEYDQLDSMLDRVDSKFRLTRKDFEYAIPNITPISKKTGFTSVPNTTFEDIGALKHLKLELKNAILKPLTNPERCA